MSLIKYTTPPCIVCKKRSLVDVPLEEGLRKWQGGALIQDAFPTLSADEREMLMTGTHPKCWDEIFGKEED